ncbi:MAG: sigma-54-dependent transcriptional regulator [Myxococcota bacterium]
MRKSNIMIVDDELENIAPLITYLEELEVYSIYKYSDGREAIEAIKTKKIDVVVCDVRMPNISGYEVLKWVKNNYPDIIVIMMTGFGSVDDAMMAMRLGAFDYLSKPFDLQKAELTIRRAIEHRDLLREKEALTYSLKERYESVDIVGKSQEMINVFKQVASIAPTDSTVLIIGESGTGKEVVARSIHKNSRRAERPFVVINCTALAESLLESELFGHEKGAFTGAISQKRGLFEEADGGTIFLDEIGDISPKMQAQILRVLDTGEFKRVGGNVILNADVRVIAATNKDLENEVKEGRFREDLFFRLDVLTLRLPPLRERGDDIELLVHHFIRKFSSKMNKPMRGISSTAMEMLRQYRWPGNVRELENAIERAVSLSFEGIITPKELPRNITKGQKEFSGESDVLIPVNGVKKVPLYQSEGINEDIKIEEGERSISYFNIVDDRPTLDTFTSRYLRLLLKEFKNNKTKVAQILGVERMTLYNMLERYNIEQKKENGKNKGSED